MSIQTLAPQFVPEAPEKNALKKTSSLERGSAVGEGVGGVVIGYTGEKAKVKS